MKNGLLLGLDGAGKTLLLRQLTQLSLSTTKSVVDRLVALVDSATASLHGAQRQSKPVPSSPQQSRVSREPADYYTTAPSLDSETQPTVGVEHTSLTLDGRAISLCEVGGQLLPMWKAYFDSCEFWVFVVDLSRPAQVGAAAIEFFEIMRVETMRAKPKLLLFNKTDAGLTLDDALLRAYFTLDRVMTDSFDPGSVSGPLHVVKGSALTGENMDAVLKWFQQRRGDSSGSGSSNGHGHGHGGGGGGAATAGGGGPSSAHVVMDPAHRVVSNEK